MPSKKTLKGKSFFILKRQPNGETFIDVAKEKSPEDSSSSVRSL